MNIRPQQLANTVGGQLPCVTMLSSQDHFLLQEAADTVRAAARAQGFLERQKLQVDKPSDWQALIQQAQSLSLFDDRKLIELHLPSAKPGDAGAKAILEYLAIAPEENRLLLLLGKLEQGSLRSKWYKSLEQQALVCRLWPVSPREMPGWINQRLRKHGLKADHDAVQLLIERVEGNLLAAAQEIEKLALCSTGQLISVEVIAKAIGSSARYNPFELVEAALQSQSTTALRMLAGLQAEGVDARSVLWALSNEIRNMNNAIGSEGSITNAMARFQKQRMAKNRMAAIQNYLRRSNTQQLQQLLQLSAEADRRIKGANRADPWSVLREIILMLGGHRLNLGT